MKTFGNVLILGDSYSTFEGAIPDGYACYYTKPRRADVPTDVLEENQTWWRKLIDETGSRLLMNNSFSGTTVCNTGYHGDDYSHISFIKRADELIERGFFVNNNVDTVFIFGCTNDSWANSPIGSLQFSDWKKEDLYQVLPAVCYLLHRLQMAAKVKNIVVLVNCALNPFIEQGLRLAAERYGVDCVMLKDIDKSSGHPTAKGMEQIKQQVLANL